MDSACVKHARCCPPSRDMFSTLDEFQEICWQWPTVTRAEVQDQLKQYFNEQLFSPSDIKGDRQKLRELLVECT